MAVAALRLFYLRSSPGAKPFHYSPRNSQQRGEEAGGTGARAGPPLRWVNDETTLLPAPAPASCVPHRVPQGPWQAAVLPDPLQGGGSESRTLILRRWRCCNSHAGTGHLAGKRAVDVHQVRERLLRLLSDEKAWGNPVQPEGRDASKKGPCRGSRGAGSLAPGALSTTNQAVRAACHQTTARPSVQGLAPGGAAFR